jgi:hypothetical protein
MCRAILDTLWLAKAEIALAGHPDVRVELQYARGTDLDAFAAADAFLRIEPENALLTRGQDVEVLVDRTNRTRVSTAPALYAYADMVIVRVFQIDDDPSPLRVENYLMGPGADGFAPVTVNAHVLVLGQSRHS